MNNSNRCRELRRERILFNREKAIKVTIMNTTVVVVVDVMGVIKKKIAGLIMNII